MTDIVDETLRQSTDVMGELIAKANEAARKPDSRRGFFVQTAKLAGATALGVAGVSLLQPIAARAAGLHRPTAKNADQLQDIINIAATAEALATTFYYNALAAGSALPDVNSTANQNYFQAAAVQEFEHLEVLKKLGAHAIATEVYVPANMFTSEAVFFPTALTLESYFISAYLAAALDFSGAVSSGITTANPYALGFAVQVLGVECEHRALLGVAANINPPNNLIIETALLSSVDSAVGALAPFLTGGDGFTGPYALPTKADVNTIAQPYGFSFFPSFKIV